MVKNINADTASLGIGFVESFGGVLNYRFLEYFLEATSKYKYILYFISKKFPYI